MPLTCYEGPEALAWLRANRSTTAGLAGNRFESTSAAIEFVELLYKAGARHIFVPQDSIRDDPRMLRDSGGPYSDSLVIELSAGSPPSSELCRIFEAEAETEGFDDMKAEDSVTDGRYLFLWWD
jgi:hypothetical protein